MRFRIRALDQWQLPLALFRQGQGEKIVGGKVSREVKENNVKISLVEDFATLFAYGWYQNFPVDGWFHSNAGRSDWTYHSALTFRRTIRQMGYFPVFERKGRSDGVALGTGGHEDVRILAEWEWQTPPVADVAAFGEAAPHYFNEVDKLLASAKSHAVQEFCFLLTYIHENDLELAVEKIQARWNLQQGKCPLVLAIITFTDTSLRAFSSLLVYEIASENSAPRLLHSKPALPWKVPHTRWTIAASE